MRKPELITMKEGGKRINETGVLVNKFAQRLAVEITPIGRIRVFDARELPRIKRAIDEWRNAPKPYAREQATTPATV
jgi:hypothetical protein